MTDTHLQTETTTPVNIDKHGAAIHGYDPVEYFKSGRPEKGTPSHSIEHNNALWWFSSRENMEEFEGNPEKYIPQYGGHCSCAMMMGTLQDINPHTYEVRDGKLYLNFGHVAQFGWVHYPGDSVKKADGNWSREKVIAAARKQQDKRNEKAVPPASK
eukprot:TRINITY_DN9697_c0_g1_i1.p1 TRINITY_DN9697_c0_g1~~TRINITY_DN9697_c0_g1_i1.p1  ORF type:complete len:157 (+),score=36.25 TRINITY_DN9697_c0_g1_i1:261-731(+)